MLKCIMLAYLMLFIALLNDVCFYNAGLIPYFALEICIAIIYTNAFCFQALYLGY